MLSTGSPIEAEVTPPPVEKGRLLQMRNPRRSVVRSLAFETKGTDAHMSSGSNQDTGLLRWLVDVAELTERFARQNALILEEEEVGTVEHLQLFMQLPEARRRLKAVSFALIERALNEDRRGSPCVSACAGSHLDLSEDATPPVPSTPVTLDAPLKDAPDAKVDAKQIAVSMAAARAAVAIIAARPAAKAVAARMRARVVERELVAEDGGREVLPPSPEAGTWEAPVPTPLSVGDAVLNLGPTPADGCRLRKGGARATAVRTRPVRRVARQIQAIRDRQAPQQQATSLAPQPSLLPMNYVEPYLDHNGRPLNGAETLGERVRRFRVELRDSERAESRLMHTRRWRDRREELASFSPMRSTSARTTCHRWRELSDGLRRKQRISTYASSLLKSPFPLQKAAKLAEDDLDSSRVPLAVPAPAQQARGHVRSTLTVVTHRFWHMLAAKLRLEYDWPLASCDPLADVDLDSLRVPSSVPPAPKKSQDTDTPAKGVSISVVAVHAGVSVGLVSVHADKANRRTPTSSRVKFPTSQARMEEMKALMGRPPACRTRKMGEAGGPPTSQDFPT